MTACWYSWNMFQFCIHSLFSTWIQSFKFRQWQEQGSEIVTFHWKQKNNTWSKQKYDVHSSYGPQFYSFDKRSLPIFMNICAELLWHNWLCLLLLIHFHATTNWLFSYVFVVFFQESLEDMSTNYHQITWLRGRQLRTFSTRNYHRILFYKEENYKLYNYKLQRIILWGDDKNQC